MTCDATGSGAASTSFRLPGRSRYPTSNRSRKRSKSASSSLPSGNSLDAPNSVTSGTEVGCPSLWNTRSFTTESREFRMALFALKTSSTNANSASGSFPVTTRAKRSCSSAFSEIAPKSSSGVENFVTSRSKYVPPNA